MKFLRVPFRNGNIARINVAHIVSYYDIADGVAIETTTPTGTDGRYEATSISRVACKASAIDDALQALADSTLTFVNVRGFESLEKGAQQ